MERLVVAIGFCMIGSGCATHHSIQLDPPDQVARALIAVEVGDGPASLDLDTAQVAEAIDVRLGTDSLRWRTRDGGRHAIDPARIEAIEIRHRGRGLLEGTLVGIGAAVLAGGVTAVCCDAAPGAWIPPEYVVGVGVGIVTIPVGALIGVVRGHPVIFEPR